MERFNAECFRNRIEIFLQNQFLIKAVFITFIITLIFQVPSLKEVPGAGPFNAIIEIGKAFPSPADYPPESHLAKKTLRPLLPLVTKLFSIENEWTLYFMFCALNLVLYGQLAHFFRRNTGSTFASLILTIGLANCYFGFSGLFDGQGWGDICCFVLIMMTLIHRNFTIVTISVLLASLGDERIFLSIPFIILWKWYRMNQLSFNIDRNNVRCLLLETAPFFIAFFGWILVRLWMIRILGFRVHIADVGPMIIFRHETSYMFPGWWSAFESYWIIVIAFLIMMFFQQRRTVSILTCGYLILFISSCYFVYDISRSLSYCFPIVLLSIVYINDATKSDRNGTSSTILCLTVVNMLSPTARVHQAMHIASPAIVHLVKAVRWLIP